MSGYGRLADQLESVAVDIDELAFDQLREAVADGATTRPQDDRRLMQARRAVEKAMAILRELDGTRADGH